VNPDANAFVAGYDALLTSGPSQALKASGRADEMAIMGGEGSVGGIELIYNGASDAGVGIPPGWEGYAAVDALIRLFAGRDPGEANSGIGIQVYDRDHNLPPEGEPYASPIDYAEAYRGIWGLD
jgi:ribose transport system substrate-binding protein